MKRTSPILVLALLVAGCAFAAMATPTPNVPPLRAVVDTPEGRIGVAEDPVVTHPVTLQLWEVGGSGSHMLTKAGETDQRLSFHVLTFGGEAGRIGNTFVFGLAPPGTQRVVMTNGPTIGSAVDGGLYLVVLAAEDVAPDALRWAFLDANGGVIEQGRGMP